MVFTSSAKLKDWKALREFHEGVLLASARACGAQRYELYRNVNDATQVLLVAEFADGDQLREFLGTWLDARGLVSSDAAHNALWEPLGWAVIPS
jgi:hypothetical protein